MIEYECVKDLLDGSSIVLEKSNGAPINEYRAFWRGNVGTLYPIRRIVANNKFYKKKISIFDTVKKK